MYYKNRIIILFFLVWLQLFCGAQDTIDDYQKGADQQNEYSQQSVVPNTFDKKNWNELKKKLKIKDYEPEKKPEIKPKIGKEWYLNISPQTVKIIQWISFGLLFAILIFLILRVLGINPFNRKADSNKINISLDELEENLDTASIDPHLYEAIKNKNYKLAIRLYYLMIIQRLALKEKIIWKKYKTNKHYLNEVRNKEEYPTLKKLTLIYEKSWFGEGDVTENDYNNINPDFVNFLQNIK